MGDTRATKDNAMPSAASAAGGTLVADAKAGQSTAVPDTGVRRMPDHVRRRLITLRDGQWYLPSAYRVVWFREDHPDWSIVTELIEGGHQAGWATVRASVIADDGRVISTGMKTESKGDFPGGWVEKAETGAVGRALALAGYGTQFAPDLEDADTSRSTDTRRVGAQRPSAATQRRPARQEARVWEGPGQCPSCHAPAGRPHSTSCQAG